MTKTGIRRRTISSKTLRSMGDIQEDHEARLDANRPFSRLPRRSRPNAMHLQQAAPPNSPHGLGASFAAFCCSNVFVGTTLSRTPPQAHEYTALNASSLVVRFASALRAFLRRVGRYRSRPMSALYDFRRAIIRLPAR